MKSSAISIIVPVYNVEKYLRRCLDSILLQTFTDWECILVDDGSNDNSGSICDEYAAKDFRFKVFHTSNGGPSKARNIGLQKARGYWISFIDSDDWIKDTFLQNLIEHSTGVDIVFTSCTVVYKDEMLVPQTLDGSYSGDDYYSAIAELIKKNMVGYTWMKLYKKDIIDKNQLRFDESITYMEDFLFTSQFLIKAHNLYSTQCHDYQYCLNENSISLGRQDADVTFKTSQKVIESFYSLSSKTSNKDLADCYLGYKSKVAANYLYACFLQSYSFRRCLSNLKRNLISESDKAYLKKHHVYRNIYIDLFTSKHRFLSTIILKMLFLLKAIVDKVKHKENFNPPKVWQQ